MPATVVGAAPSAASRSLGALRLLLREPGPLVPFALGMLLLAIPTLAALLLDPRTVHGVANWAKPLKFMASTALFALTMAAVVRMLPEPVRRSRPVLALAWVVVATAGFEVAYITFQAALGAGSHYNTGDAFHAVMFGLMGIAAVVLVCTQPVLAWHLGRHLPSTVTVRAVRAGLWLTCLLSVASGFLLGGMQPPAGSGLPIVGWHLGGGDLRPAHFLAVHAQQLLPLAGLALGRLPPRVADALLPLVVVAVILAWAALVWAGLPAVR